MDRSRQPVSGSWWFIVPSAVAGVAATVVFGPLVLLALNAAARSWSRGEAGDLASTGLAAMALGGLAGLIGFWGWLFTPQRVLRTHRRLRQAYMALVGAGVLAASAGAAWSAIDGVHVVAIGLASLAAAGGVIVVGMWGREVQAER